MIDWIKKTIYPPGIEKPNRLALFSIVGEVMSRVGKYAQKAFYAHFPYLADKKKLEEHGQALLIPHLPNDTPQEYRNRVATASFFLMQAGERGYVMEQLKERFGERFIVIEEFLSIHTKVTELNDDERSWVLDLFDSLINPNIYIELSELYNFIEKLPVFEPPDAVISKTSMTDSLNIYFRNGSILRNGKHRRGSVIHRININTILNVLEELPVTENRQMNCCNIFLETCQSLEIFTVNQTANINDSADSDEKTVINVSNNAFDILPSIEKLLTDINNSLIENVKDKEISIINLSININDTVNQNEIVSTELSMTEFTDDIRILDEEFTIGYRIHLFRNGVHKRDGTVRRKSTIPIPLEK